MNNDLTTEVSGLLKKLDAQLADDKKQHDLLGKRIAKNEALRKALTASLSLHESTGYGAKAAIIREAVGRITNQRFTQDDVEAEVRRVDPGADLNRNRVRAAIWNLYRKEKIITLVRPGNNRQPALFEKVGSVTNGESNGSHNEAQRTARGIATSTGVVTIGQIEDLVRQKNRRINQLASRFGVAELTIRELIQDPSSKVIEASRGWVKMRE